MKLSPFIVMATLSLSPLGAHADVDSVVTMEKESGVEADHDTMQIKDLEAERKMAKEQADMQSSIAKEAKDRLDKVKSQKEVTLEKAKAEIANYQQQRRDAEKADKKYKEETARLTAEIQKLEEGTDKARHASKDAVDIAKAGKEELNMVRERKVKLEAEYKQAVYAQAQADGEMAKLRAEYNRVNQSLKELQQRINLNQEELKKKQAMIAIGSRKVAELQSKEVQMKTALGIKSATAVAKAPAITDPKTAIAASSGTSSGGVSVAKPVADAKGVSSDTRHMDSVKSLEANQAAELDSK